GLLLLAEQLQERHRRLRQRVADLAGGERVEDAQDVAHHGLRLRAGLVGADAARLDDRPETLGQAPRRAFPERRQRLWCGHLDPPLGGLHYKKSASVRQRRDAELRFMYWGPRPQTRGGKGQSSM